MYARGNGQRGAMHPCEIKYMATPPDMARPGSARLGGGAPAARKGAVRDSQVGVKLHQGWEAAHRVSVS